MRGPLKFFMPTVAHSICRIREMTYPMYGSDKHCLSLTGFVSPRPLYLVLRHVDYAAGRLVFEAGHLHRAGASLCETLGNDAAGNCSVTKKR